MYLTKTEFNTMHELNHHAATEHNTQQMSCDDCNRVFAKKSHIRKHVKIHFNKICKICNKNYQSMLVYKYMF